jgi:ribosome-associated protein
MVFAMDTITHPIVPENELSFTYSRSGGPGGQNVNKVETRVTLWFDVNGSASLNDEQKQLIHERLSTRINKNGSLWVVSKQHRTQLANRMAAVQRFSELLQQALQPTPKRHPRRMPRSSREARLQQKRRRSEIKQARQQPFSWE